MNPHQSVCKRVSHSVGGICLLSALTLFGLHSQAALTHRYSFTNNAQDSIGGAHGIIQGNVTVADGVAYFPGQSNLEDYIELPSGLISNYTSVSFEFWIDVFDNGPWQEIYAFGTQTAAGQGANMIMFSAHTGSTPPDFRMSYAQAAPGFNDERVVAGVGVLDNAGPVHVVSVYDPPNNAMSLYTNGVLVGTLSPVTTGAVQFSLTNVHNVNSWLGRSLYNADSPYNGTIDEFRIYNEAIGPLQAFVGHAAGPDTAVTNITVNSLTWSAPTNLVLGTRQSTAVTFNTANYGSVTLAGATEATYSSSNPAIVDVDARGQLLARELGSTTVSAVFGNTTNSVQISVIEPQIVHRYTFNTDANDSVGNAHGTLMNGATVAGGMLTLPGGTTSSDPAAAYVDLPNNLLTNFTAITVETWVTDNGSENWARVWDFGNSVGGEDFSDTGSRYMFLSLPSGAGELVGNIRIDDRGGDHTVAWVGNRPAVGEEAHVVWATDVPRRTAWLYVNGALVGMNTNTFMTPADIGPSVNNWLGRSQWGGDAAFNGTINELRIFNGPITPLQVAFNAAAGPNNIITNPGPLQSIQVTLGTNQVIYGGLPVSVTVRANYADLTNVNVTTAGTMFQSSNPNILTVGPQGVITAVDVGTANVSAVFGGQTGTVEVAVSLPAGHRNATLAHRYSFDEAAGSQTVRDSVGTANGVIAGTGAVFGGGQLTLPGGTGSDVDPETIAAYVDLPNGIISALTNASFEAWVTWQGSSQWQRIFDFGTSSAGEDVSSGNGNYLFLSPLGPAALRFSVRDPETGTEPAPLTAPGALAANQEIYIAVTYNQADNVARLYSNAVLVATSTAPVALTGIEDVNNWLGRSQWNDPMFQGRYNEFRIWDGVLLPNQISANHSAGPDSLEPAPRLTAALTANGLSISWPAAATGFVLQTSPQLGTGATWTAVSTAPTTANGLNTVTVPIGAGTQFYRLSR